MQDRWHKLPLPEYKAYGAESTDDPWLTEVTAQEVEKWRSEDMASRWCVSDAYAQCLIWLKREFGGRGR